ncbi:MAG: hypothetical protein AAGA60_03445 [Cyanobacteria bacterium P01_E01_bin.42]
MTRVSPIAQLEDWLAVQTLTYQEVQDKYLIADEHIRRDGCYINLDRLIKLHNPQTHPGWLYYFKDCSFAAFYIEEIKGELQGFTRQILRDYCGEPEAILPSHGGRSDLQYIYASKGIAFSADDKRLSFLVIFPPMSLEDYKTDLYYTPSPYIR